MQQTVIDGYNLVMREREEGVSLQDLREAFLLRVAAVRRPGHPVTVVFDGVSSGSSSRRFADGLRVLYSRKPRSADDLIVTLVSKAHRGQVTVLTFDRELAGRVKSAGGRIGDPEAFFRLPDRAREPRRREKPPPPTGDETDFWERIFRDRDGEK